MKFTDRQVQALEPRAERFEVWEQHGLGVRVSPGGRKSWVFLYRIEGRPRRMTLGRYPAMSVARAHAAHGRALAEVERGIDPGAAAVMARRADRMALIVNDLAQEYLEKHARAKKRSWEQDDSILRREVLPILGKHKAKDIRRRDVIDLLDHIVRRGAPIAANRTFAITRRMFSWAVERDILELSPCDHVPRPAPEHRRDRVLTETELRKVWVALESANAREPARLALGILLATAQRPGEVVGASWEEVDFTAHWWTIPGERAKNGLTHRVPLTPLAIRLFGRARMSGVGSPWVFPSPRQSHKALERHALRVWIAQNLKDLDVGPFTPQDLRRTAASYMTSMGIPRLVVAKILNHAETGVTAVYDRNSYDREKKEALATWAGKLERVSDAQQGEVCR